MVGEPPVQGFWLPGGGVDCRRAALRPGVGWCGCPSGSVIMAACHCGFGSADSALCQSAVLVCAAMACRHSPGVAAGIFQNLPYWLAKRPVRPRKTARIASQYGPFCCGLGAAAHLLQAQMASTDRLGGCKPLGVWRLRSRLAGPQQAPGGAPVRAEAASQCSAAVGATVAVAAACGPRHACRNRSRHGPAGRAANRLVDLNQP